MTRLTTKLTILGLLTLLAPARGVAQAAVEDALSNDLEYRGQGRASLCYAFAEEQVLKDFTCVGDCAYDASRWTFSIFDLARLHQERFARRNGSPITDPSRDLFDSGSYFAFPYAEVGATSVRASKCTLEKEIFFLNRSKISNPSFRDQPRDDMVTYLWRIYGQFQGNPNTPPPIMKDEIRAVWPILARLAAESKTYAEFMTRVIDYTRCADRVPMPAFEVRTRATPDLATLPATLRTQLDRGHSIYVGVCAEVLADEKFDARPCGRHAVVLRRYDPKANRILVVDSAFFSIRPRNPDGSTWIDAAVVSQAIEKSQLDFDRIVAEARASVSQTVEATDFAASARQMTADFELGLRDVAPTNLRAAILQNLADNMALNPTDRPERMVFEKTLAHAKHLRFRSLADLKQLTPLFERYGREAVAGQYSARNLPPSGLVWLEAPGSHARR